MTMIRGVATGLTRPLLLLATVTLVGACAGPESSVDPPGAEDPVAAVQAWRDGHEAHYLRDWVSIAGLHLLPPGSHTLGADETNDIVIPNLPPTIGRLVVTEDSVVYEPAPGIEAVHQDVPVTAPLVLKEAGGRPSDEVVVGEVRLVVHETGNRLSLRVRDPNGELAREFLGFTWFPIDTSYRVTARFIPDEAPRDIPVLNTFDDIDTYRTEGVVEFTLHGQVLRLRPFTTGPNRFYFVFRDASSGEETYSVARFFYSDLLEDGTTVLDFNEAYNPPCAFNPYTTCPVPLRENRLPVKILAGEKAYPIEVKLPGGGD